MRRRHGGAEVPERRPDRRRTVHVEPHPAHVRLVEDGRADQLDGHGHGLRGGEGDGVLGRRGPAPGSDGEPKALSSQAQASGSRRARRPSARAGGVRREPIVHAGDERRQRPALPGASALDQRAVRGGSDLEGLEERHVGVPQRVERRPALVCVDRVEEDRFARFPLERAEGDG